MPKLNSNGKGKDIWSLITEEQLVAAIVSLGDCIKELDRETWRIKTETKLSV